MRVVDFIRISYETMKVLSRHDIKSDDYRFLQLFVEYEKMVGNGLKISYIVECLSARHSISVSSVYRILKRFKATVKV